MISAKELKIKLIPKQLEYVQEKIKENLNKEEPKKIVYIEGELFPEVIQFFKQSGKFRIKKDIRENKEFGYYMEYVGNTKK